MNLIWIEDEVKWGTSLTLKFFYFIFLLYLTLLFVPRFQTHRFTYNRRERLLNSLEYEASCEASPYFRSSSGWRRRREERIFYGLRISGRVINLDIGWSHISKTCWWSQLRATPPPFWLIPPLERACGGALITLLQHPKIQPIPNRNRSFVIMTSST